MTTFVPSSEQQAIITFPSLPVRIAAGAGTGKTTTIVERLHADVARGTDPARALGITFTNKAADELRDRLRVTIPDRPDGREVEVATYHGFAASILDEFGSRIGYSTGSQLMDEAHRSELAVRVLRSYDGEVLDLTALQHRREELLTLASNMRDNLVTASDVLAHAPDKLDETWEKRLALASAVAEFESQKVLLGLIEYGDLMRLATQIVEEHPSVAAEITARYDTVLLDEYQDTDPVQRRLLRGLFAGAVPITAVGDTDQTIYEWRGASIDNFEEFPRDFPNEDGTPAATLPLSINRRSDRTIIAMANAVQRELPESGGAGPLVPRDDAGDGEVLAAWHTTEREEAAWIASDILDRRAEGTPFDEIAILCRKRDGMGPIAKALQSAGIPYTVGSMGELLSVPEIADLVAWLSVLADPTDEPALLRVLMGGRYRLGSADIATLNRARPAKSATLIDAVLAEGLPGFLDADAQAAVASFALLFEELFVQSQAMSVPAILQAVIDGLGYWGEVAALPEARSITTRINVTRFVDLTERWKPLDGTPSLSGYLRYLEALDESGRAEELDAAEVPSDDAVRILTAHGAKGLEWDEVYIPALSARVFPSSVLKYYDPLDSHVALPYQLRLDGTTMAEVDAIADPKERKRLLKIRHDHQEWRLAYVAVTRARHRLVLSGHAWHKDNLRSRKPSELLDLALEQDFVTKGPIADEPGPRPEIEPYSPTPPAPDPLFDHGWSHALRETVVDPAWVATSFPELEQPVNDRENQLNLELADLKEPTVAPSEQEFATSVTNLVALAECPLKFRWIHHDRLPRKPRTSAVRGTEFHRKAELHNLGVVSLDDPGAAAYDAVDADAQADTSGGVAGEPAVDPWTVFTQSRFHDERPRFVETPFEVTLDGRRIRGKIDAIYAEDDRWEIVDYKSGAPSTTDAKSVQLQAYALAATDGAVSVERPSEVSVTFAYFGVDPVQSVTVDADDQWLTEARATIGVLLEQAEDGPFPAQPSPSCRWCDFLHHCEAGQTALKASDQG